MIDQLPTNPTAGEPKPDDSHRPLSIPEIEAALKGTEWTWGTELTAGRQCFVLTRPLSDPECFVGVEETPGRIVGRRQLADDNWEVVMVLGHQPTVGDVKNRREEIDDHITVRESGEAVVEGALSLPEKPVPSELSEAEGKACRMLHLPRKELAERLSVVPGTVSTHVLNARRKLGAKTPAEITLRGLREGWVDRHPQELADKRFGSLAPELKAVVRLIYRKPAVIRHRLGIDNDELDQRIDAIHRGLGYPSRGHTPNRSALTIIAYREELVR